MVTMSNDAGEQRRDAVTEVSGGGEEVLHVGAGARISLNELRFTFQQSGGPGGQNVNKVATRVTLSFDLTHSPSLTPAQKSRIAGALSTRINKEGSLRVVASRHRTQAANRRAATQRFVELVTDALRVAKPRKETGVPKAAKRKRREDKLRRSEVKQRRQERFRRED
jgi:ribosome-associated protein